MKDQQLVQQLMATFLDELHVHVSSIGRELLALEKDPSEEERAESWTTVFRAAHTLKGASAVVDVVPINVACHRLEDIFEIYRASDRPLSEEMTSTLLKAVDAIEEIGMRLRDEQDLEGAPLLDLLPELERLAATASREDDAGEQASEDDAVAVDNQQPSEAEAELSDDGSEFEIDEDLSETSESAAAATSPPSSPALSFNESLLPVFLEELEDRCASITQDAIAMETVTEPEAQTELLTSLFRSAHSLKGASGVVKLDVLQSVCHRLEDRLDEIRSGQSEFTTQTATALLEAVDAFRDLGERLKFGQGLEDAPILSMIERLDSLLPPIEPAAAESDSEAAKDKAGAKDQKATAKGAGTDKKAAATSKKPAASRPTPSAKPAPKKKRKRSAKSTTASTPSPKTGSTAATDSSAPAADKVARSRAAESGATIRVSAQKLDALLAHSGELLVARGRLAVRTDDASAVRSVASDLNDTWRASQEAIRDLSELAARPGVGKGNRAASVLDKTATQLSALTSKLESLATAMEADKRLLQQACKRLDDEVLNVRMLPFSEACGALQRAVRDIATSTNKKIRLEIVGEDTEVDRSVLEGLKDPLLHLVRNSADHGCESPQQREESGKPAMATITVSAALRNGQVEVRVEDDGGGLDLNRICDIAREREIEIPDDPREQARLIFAPGFSTAKLVTDISGRGVGLDVVQGKVEDLHGSVDVSFKPKKGTRFTLTVPLTLTTIRSMLVVASGQTYAIPTSAIQRLVRFGRDDLKSSAGRDSLLLGDSPTPVVSLARTLGLPSQGPLVGPSSKGLAIVLTSGEQRVAVVVDEVKQEQEVLVKNLGARVRLRHFSGCTLLPDGRIALVITPGNVVRTALGSKLVRSSVSRSLEKGASQSESGGKRLLLVEDSMTTRELLKNILETAGYEVVTAVDGQQAWETLQEQTFDLLVTDVDMPRMSGFDLAEKVRGTEALLDLPIVLVTSRGSDSDKERGVQVGADAYIVKGNFEQGVLLDTIQQLV